MPEFTLVPLSPCHVGGGQLLRGPMDLYLDGGILFLLHQEKMVRRLSGHPGAWKAFNDFVDAANTPRERPEGGRPGRGGRGDRDRGKKPPRKNPTETLKNTLKRFQIKPGEVARAAYRWPQRYAPHQVQPFVRLGTGRAVLPGSSLKGAIRTALLHEASMNEDGTLSEVFRSELKALQQQNQIRPGASYASRNLESQILGRRYGMNRFRIRDGEVSYKNMGLVEAVVQNAVDVPTGAEAAPLDASEVAIGRGGSNEHRGPKKGNPRRKPSDQPVYLTRMRGYTDDPHRADVQVYESIIVGAGVSGRIDFSVEPKRATSAETEEENPAPVRREWSTAGEILKALRVFAERQIKLEMEFLSKHKSFQRLLAFYVDLQKKASELPEHATLIRIGEGKGWLGIGGAILDTEMLGKGADGMPPLASTLSEKGYREFPKTRVIAARQSDMDLPFGWAKLEFMI